MDFFALRTMATLRSKTPELLASTLIGPEGFAATGAADTRRLAEVAGEVHLIRGGLPRKKKISWSLSRKGGGS